VTEHGGILADVHDCAGDHQREGHELVQGDIEGNAVARRARQPFGQAGALGREVQDQDPASEIVDDDATGLP
jgi:hypothetical protein